MVTAFVNHGKYGGYLHIFFVRLVQWIYDDVPVVIAIIVLLI